MMVLVSAAKQALTLLRAAKMLSSKCGSTPLMVERSALKPLTTDIQYFQSVVIKVPISVSSLL